MDTGLGGSLPYEFEYAYDYEVSLPKNQRNHVMDSALKDFVRITAVSPWVVKDDAYVRMLKEWAIFDWPFYKHNYTMMEEFLDHPPEDVDMEVMDVVQTAYETNTVCEFFVEGAFPEEAAVVLRDVASNNAYVVRDASLAAHIAAEPIAMIGARIVRVDDDWMMPTGPIFVVGGTFDEERKQAICAEAEPVDFCDLVHSAYSYLEMMGYPGDME